MTAKEFVLAKYPEASCSGPITTYWPKEIGGQGHKPSQWLITTEPHLSVPFASADSEDLCWERAATRITINHLHLALEQFADETNWNDKVGYLQWIGKRHAVEYAKEVLNSKL